MKLYLKTISQDISCHKPTADERNYLTETLRHHSDSLDTQTIEKIADRISIGDDMQEKTPQISGFYKCFTDRIIISSKLLEASQRS